jgi:hypothetical protein
MGKRKTAVAGTRSEDKDPLVSSAIVLRNYVEISLEFS